MPRYVLSPDAALHVVGQAAAPSADALLAPTLLRPEVLDRLYRAARAGELTASEAEARRRRFDGLKVRYLGDRVLRRTAWKIAEEAGEDGTGRAEYVALTQLQADALVTEDAALTALAQGRAPVRPLSVLS
ncbi:type II toxin-antitoxin system VapC family toxin [Wenxinia marina]|uniref:Nucleic acid-binding protein n=1 Tax=Wenxinia marina DSM 24838 TaxID=1123501 RepID=A0A0D0NPH6_9RHOB|nr:hypothetical protein [Wenxinia marina]KIQ70165.1 hypothetical protein Wenmar_01122 [Wenxinia marina DSM 24838]GGL50934.1 hypothetical protein GCM10011392_01340 [Wenxinia marina]